MKKLTIIVISGILLLGTFILLTSVGISEETNGNLFYVGGSGNGNYSTIQDAINASSDEDTIFVYKGTYNETLEVNKSISLIGQNKENTIISGKHKMDVIAIKASNVSISGFTIQDGLLSGIWIEVSSNCNIFQNNINNNGFGIFARLLSNSSIFNNTISNNFDTGIKISAVLPAYNATLCSENNTIYHNNFINNSQHAYDECDNSWFYVNEGNYWENYSGLDKNNDGIGDEQYDIPGGNSIDQYPLMMPYYGRVTLKEFYVEEGPLYMMLVIGLAVAILFILPIGYYWYRKYYKK
jgi:parallel beta-helix repeat protein